MSGSKGTQRQDPVPAGSISPTQTAFADLFGFQSEVNPKGVIQLLQGGPDPNAIFAPGAFDAVGDLLTQSTPFAQDILGGLGRGAEISGDLGGLATDTVLPGLERFLSGDVKVDPSAAIGRAQTDMLERFSGLGQTFSSDLATGLTRTAAELDIDAQNRADELQLRALGGFGSLGQDLIAQQSASANDLLQVGGAFNAANTDAGRAATVLQMLQGAVPTGAVPLAPTSRGRQKSGGI
jgi:hypothetical protein